MSVVVLVGSTISVPALGENDDVGGATEGIGEDGARAEVDVGVVAGGLVGGGAIKVPDGEVLGLVLLLRESLESHCQSGRSERSDVRCTECVIGAAPAGSGTAGSTTPMARGSTQYPTFGGVRYGYFWIPLATALRRRDTGAGDSRLSLGGPCER